MAPDTDAQTARDEFEVAWYTKELGRPLQRKLLQRRFDEIGEGHSVFAASSSAHGEETDRARHDQPAREERAG